jgi:hypothetical protein
MGIKKFNEFFDNDFKPSFKEDIKPIKESIKNSKKVSKKTRKKPSVVSTNKSKKVNEAAFEVGDDFKVKLTFDVPKSLVTEYINKVKEKTGKNPLDNFSTSEIAEQMIQYLVKENLVIDNLPPDFTVGSEKKSEPEEYEIEQAEDDLEDLEEELGSEEESEEESKDEIEFDLEQAELEDDDIEIETNEVEIEDSKDEETKKKSVGDYKKTEEDLEEDEEELKPDSSYDLDELFKEVGYNTKYYESLNLNNFKNNL